jgi:hypothetical protein
MARTRKAATPAPVEAEAMPGNAPAAMPEAEAATGTAAGQPREPAKEAAHKPAYAADPHAKISVSLSDHQGGPVMHLLRSHKYNQIQIRFDGEQPDEQHLARLKETGWKDRTESEGVWTKQVDRDMRWQSVQDMEREFKAVANAIRQDKGLEPALEGLAVA